MLCGSSRNRRDVKGCGGGQEFANFVIVGKVRFVEGQWEVTLAVTSGGEG